MARRGDGIFLRGKTWWLDFQHEGRRHVVRLGRNIARNVARELATVKRGAILKGEAGIGKAKRKDLTFEQAAERFLAWAEANKKPRTHAGYRGCLHRLKRSFGGKRLSEVDPLSVERHKHARIKAGAPIAGNRELATLKALMNRCRALGLYDGSTPEIKLVREPRTRLRFLDAEEEARLLEASSEALRALIVTGINTGLRIKAEALTLEKQDVDLARGTLTVQAAYAKNGRTRTVPLNSAARQALAAAMERAPGAYVFARPDGRPLPIRKAFEAAVSTAKLTGVTPHTLRHTFASRLAMAGVDLRTVMELGGWASLDMVLRYAHLSPDHKASAVERIVPAAPRAANSTTLITTPARTGVGERRLSVV
jgi:integrase